jgi:hypothetical protein
MHYTVVDMGEYLRADLLDRETAADTRAFLDAIRDAAETHASERLLICVHSPQAVFRVEEYKASVFLDGLAARPSFKVALVASHLSVQLSHQYLELLAHLRGASLRSFPDELQAIDWLMAAPVASAPVKPTAAT